MAGLPPEELRAIATKALEKLAFKPDPNWTLAEWASEAKGYLNKRKKKTVVTATALAPYEVARQILLVVRPKGLERVLPGKRKTR